MATIKTLKPTGKHAYELTLEGPSETLSLHRETVVAHRLFSADALDANQLKAIKRDDTFYRALSTSLDALARQNHTERALRGLLKRHDYDATTIDKAVKKLKKDGYLNEEKALETWLEMFFSSALKGPRYVRQKLRDEGYEPALIDDALARYNTTLEKEKLNAFLTQSAPQLSGAKRDRIRKFSARAINAGFTPELVFEATERFVEATHDSEAEAEALRDMIAKLRRQHDITRRSERDKLIQKLMRKGYDYNTIRRAIESEE